MRLLVFGLGKDSPDVACRVPLRDLGRQGAADRAFRDLVARLDNPMFRPEVAEEARRATARVQARCDAAEELGLGGVEFRLRVMFIDAFGPEEEEDDDSGSDMEFGEFDLSGARNLQDQQNGAGYEGGDDDDGCGAQFSARPYLGGSTIAREDGNLLLSGFEARSDVPELTEQHELTSHDMAAWCTWGWKEAGAWRTTRPTSARWPAARSCRVPRAPPWSTRRCSPPISTASNTDRQARSSRCEPDSECVALSSICHSSRRRTVARSLAVAASCKREQRNMRLGMLGLLVICVKEVFKAMN